MDHTRPFYTVGRLAERLDVDRTTIWRWLRRGEFPKPVRVGRIARWDPDAIDNWLRERSA